MAIRAQNDITRQRQRFFAQNLMANAAPNFKKMFNVLLSNPIADFGMILRVARGWRGNSVIKRNGYTVWISDTGRADVLKNTADCR
jgi:hypothetical protein